MSNTQLNYAFSALSDPTRRAIIARLASGDASVNELMKPFKLSQPAISKHIKVLENAGLISRKRVAQTRPCHLEAKHLKKVADWIDHYRHFWTESFGRLDNYFQQIHTEQEKGK